MSDLKAQLARLRNEIVPAPYRKNWMEMIESLILATVALEMYKELDRIDKCPPHKRCAATALDKITALICEKGEN